MAVEAGNVFFFLIGKSYVRYIFQVDNFAIGIINDCILNFVKTFVLAAGLHIESFRTSMNISAGYVSCFTLYAADHIIYRDVLFRYLVQLQVNADDLFWNSPVFNFLQALYLFKVFF